MKLDIAQLEFIAKKLRCIVTITEEKLGIELTGTSLYRIGDSGVHGVLPLRGVDVRMRNKEIGLIVEEFINTKWVYDPERPDKKCAILHGKNSNQHLHIQTHPNTRLR